MKYIIDSSAWIDYLAGGPEGEKVNQFLKENNEIITLPINIAEVISYLKRKDENADLGYNAIIKNSKIFTLTPKISKESGLLHAEIKKRISNFSLADAFIITAAKSISANLITSDSHFKSFKEAIVL